MRATIRPPAELELVLTLSDVELLELFDATRPGRRTRAQLRLLEGFGNMLHGAMVDRGLVAPDPPGAEPGETVMREGVA